MFSYWPTHMAEQKQGDQLEPTYGSSVRIQDVTPRTCQKQWTIGRSGERGSRISVLETRHDDDDDDSVLLQTGASSPDKVTKAEEPSLPYKLPIAGGRIIGFIPFPRVLVLCEMQSGSSRIWTRVVVSITPRAPPELHHGHLQIDIS